MMNIRTIKSYYYLTKPGIIYGNLLTAVAGFLLASGWNIDLILFGATILGTGLIIASSCVINNYIDRKIDSKMERTEKRAFVTGKISKEKGLTFAAILGFLGFSFLILFTNWLVVLSGITAMFSYVVVYGYFKRKSPVGTWVGTVPGAMSLVAGNLAVTGKIDLGVILLFLIMVFWQLPHFYAIGIFRLHDYREAGLPILPVVRGARITKFHILICMVLFLISVVSLSLAGYTGSVFMIAMVILSGYWIFLGIKGFKTLDDTKWARKVFGFSLIILMSMSVLMSLNVVLP